MLETFLEVMLALVGATAPAAASTPVTSDGKAEAPSTEIKSE